MSFEYFLAFLISCALVYFLTPLVRHIAFLRGIVDYPSEPRKIHSSPVPLLGGWAVYAGFAFTVLLWLIFSKVSFGYFIHLPYFAGILLGGAILCVGGYLDDKYHLPPYYSIIAPLLAVLVVIVFGVQLSYINNPFGGVILLDAVKFLDYPVFGGVFVFVWILGMIYTTKFLDGMDGLVSGVSGIGALAIFFVSLLPQVGQSDTALLAIIFAGAILGFLPWNFHPAKIFLGEGGSTLAGFMVGVLAVISGGKIATALLVMGIPILDAAWVIIRRLFSHYSPFQPDRKHLHFRLLDVGLSQRQAVLFLYFLVAAFGACAIYLQSLGKVMALGILLVVMLILGGVLVYSYKKKVKNEK